MKTVKYFASACLAFAIAGFAYGQAGQSSSTSETASRGTEGSVSFGNDSDRISFSGGSSESHTTTTTDNAGNSTTSNSDSAGSKGGVSYSHTERDGGKTTTTTASGTGSGTSNSDGSSSYSTGVSVANETTTTSNDGSGTERKSTDRSEGGIGSSGGQTSTGEGNASFSIGGTQSHTDTTTTTSDDGKTTHETTTTDSTHVGTTVSSDEKTGETTATIGVDRTIGGGASVTYGDANGTHGGAGVSGEVKGGVGGSGTIGPGYVEGGLEAGISAHGSVSVEGQYGNDQYNVHGEGEITISAELAAKLKAHLGRDGDGYAAVVSGEAGAAVSLEGKITGGITVCGVPIDVTLSGGVSAGAQVSGTAGAVFKDGKLIVTLEASAVLGVGAKGGIQVEVGVDQLKDLLLSGISNGAEKLVTAILGDESDYINDLLNTNDLGERIRKILKHELEKNEKWKSMGGENLLQNILDMIANGCDFGTAYQLARAAARGDMEEFSRILEIIRQKMAAGKNGGETAFDNPNPESGDGGSSTSEDSGPKPVGLTPLQAY